MEIREFDYLIAIAEEGSISGAADRLFMAQSSLSQYLRKYESELGVKLFVRTSTGIRPTPTGEVMIRQARRLLSEYRQVKSEIRDIEELKTGKIELGISTFRGSFMLPKILIPFRNIYPGVQVEISESNSMNLEQKLMEGKLDMAIVALPLTKINTDISFLKHDEICIACHRDHPVMEHTKLNKKTDKLYVDMKDAAKYEFILSDHDTILGSVARDEFARHNLVPKVCNGNLTAPFALKLAAAGYALAFTYDSCCEDSSDVRYLSIGQKGIYIKLGIAYPPDGYRSKATIELSKLFHMFLGQE